MCSFLRKVCGRSNQEQCLSTGGGVAIWPKLGENLNLRDRMRNFCDVLGESKNPDPTPKKIRKTETSERQRGNDPLSMMKALISSYVTLIICKPRGVLPPPGQQIASNKLLWWKHAKFCIIEKKIDVKAVFQREGKKSCEKTYFLIFLNNPCFLLF